MKQEGPLSLAFIGIISSNSMSYAGAPPVFSIAIANLTQSLASTLLKLLLINPLRVDEVIGGKLKEGHETLNGLHFPDGFRAGVNRPFGLLVATTPFLITSLGSLSLTCATATWQNRSPECIFLALLHLVRHEKAVSKGLIRDSASEKQIDLSGVVVGSLKFGP